MLAINMWERCVFAFIVAVCEINTHLATKNNSGTDDKDIIPSIQKQLIWSLIDNTFSESV